MGWDAYALTHSEQAAYGSEALDLVQRAIFWEANAELIRRTGSGGLLIDGQLSGSSLPFLIRATPVVCFDPDIEGGVLTWPKATVKEASERACWDFAIDNWFNDFLGLPTGFMEEDGDFYEYLRCETRLFLETCAEHELAILFTW